MAFKNITYINATPSRIRCDYYDLGKLKIGINTVLSEEWNATIGWNVSTDAPTNYILDTEAVISVLETDVHFYNSDGEGIYNISLPTQFDRYVIARVDKDNEVAQFAIAAKVSETEWRIITSHIGNDVYNALAGSVSYPEDVLPDPYAEHKPSEIVNENKGEWDFPDEIVASPEEPTDNVTDTGFITCWKVTEPTLQALASYMWTSGFFDTIIKNFGDPIDTLLSLHLLPIDVPTKSGLLPIKAGNVETGVSAYKVGKQFVTFDCGTIHISEQFGSYLDYSPFTKFEIVLPFMSTYALDPDIIVGHDLHLYYRIDVATGACLAFIDVDGRNIYSFSGNCAVEMPITSANYSQLYQTIASMATSAITRGVSSGASVPATKTMSGKGGHAGQILSGIVGGVEGAGSSAMSNINNMKPEYQKVGALGSSLALMSPKKPFLIVTYPNICAPENLNKFVGYPSYVTMPLASCKGYTEVDHIELNGINATDYEMQEIENYLKSGVIF